LAGPNVTSGIQRKGLERYAATMQEQLGDATQQLQDEANLAATQEANEQAQLDDYLAQLELQKKQNVINAATALKQYSAY
jgi:3-dehydroquinate dehydratase